MNIQKRLIHDLSLLEVVKTDLNQKSLPTVFFYHGWEGYKERVLEEAYRLAEQDFRVILPDAYNHGERKKTPTHDPMSFWEVVGETVKEFPKLVDVYVREGKTQADRVGVAGLSMGGIISSAILTQYDWVNSASILMGSPAPIQLTEWILANNAVESQLSEIVKDKEFVQKKLAELAPISLDLHANRLAGRPLYIWHGSEDQVVPVEFTQKFVQDNQDKDYGANIQFEITEGVGHKVPGEIIQRMSVYFQRFL